jgi:hypothetical protein
MVKIPLAQTAPVHFPSSFFRQRAHRISVAFANSPGGQERFSEFLCIAYSFLIGPARAGY